MARAGSLLNVPYNTKPDAISSYIPAANTIYLDIVNDKPVLRENLDISDSPIDMVLL